jgi:hypothetical protein
MVAEAKADVAALVAKAVSLAAQALEGRDADEVRMAFSLPGKEAPKWTDLVTSVAKASAKSETDRPLEIRQTLNVVMVARDSSTAEWVQRARGALDVPELPALEAPKP